MEPVVFVNIAWMKFYRGPRRDDPLIPGNFAYFKTREPGAPKKVGHEQWNFAPRQGRVVGYVPRSALIDLKRLGGGSATRMDNVLVVFMARDPVARVLKVVGWYRRATVSRALEFDRTYGRTTVQASITGPARWAYVIPVGERDLVVPSWQKVKGGVGQSPVWYGEAFPDLVQEIRRRAARRRPGVATETPSKPSRPPRNPDPEKRLAVEARAMDWAMAYFDGAIDVSRKKLGWDVEAKGVQSKTLVEVKGLLGTRLCVELTPREYDAMQQHRGTFILFVLTSALARRPRARVFRYRPRRRYPTELRWTTDAGEVLQIQERIGAWCQLQA